MFSINKSFHDIFKAIGYKTRTDILIEIAQSDRLTLMQLSEKFKMKPQTLEFHIQKLKAVGLIKSRREKGHLLLIFNREKLDMAIESLKSILTQRT